MKKSVYYTLVNRGLDPNIPWSQSEILALEDQKWYGVQGFTSLGHFTANSLPSQSVNLPTGSSTMTIAVGARWDGRPTGANSTILGFAKTVVSGWSFQDRVAVPTLRCYFGNVTMEVSHSMVAGNNYTFAVTLQNSTASLYVNGHYVTGNNSCTYTTPKPTLSYFQFGDDSEAALPAKNWTLNFFTIAPDTALTATEVSGWNYSLRQHGPTALPSASNFWNAADLAVSGTHNHISGAGWTDSIGGVLVHRYPNQAIILREYTPKIPFGIWT